MNPRIQSLLAEQQNGEGGSDSGGSNGANGADKNKKPEIKPVEIPTGMKGEVFHFRKEKVKVKNEDGTETEVGEAYKHPSIMVPLPVTTREQLAAFFNAPSEGEGNKAAVQKYVLDLISDAIYSQAREQINEYREEQQRNGNNRAEVSAQILDYSKLDVEALANMPASERGVKISDEDMAAFLADYSAVMPAASNKDAKKVAAQAGVLEKQLRTVRTDKKVLKVMEDLLTIWFNASENAQEHQTVYEFFTNRIKRWLTAEPKNVLESIM